MLNKISRFLWRKIIPSLAFSALALAGGSLIDWMTPANIITEVSLLFVTLNVIAAIRFGLVVGGIVAITNSMVFNYFFIYPLYSLRADPESTAVVIGLIVSTLTCSLMAGRMTEVLKQNRRFIRRRNALIDMMDEISEANTPQAIFKTLQQLLEQTVHCSVHITPYPTPRKYKPSQHITALGGKPMPIAYGSSCFGVMKITPNAGRVLTIEDDKFIEICTQHCAQALNRLSLRNEATENLIMSEKEALRSTLLSSISHDLKTPLAGIVGSLSTLQQLKDRLSEDDQNELLKTAEDEAERLNRLIDNVLAMTRLDAGVILPKRSWTPVAEIIDDVKQRIHKRFPSLKITCGISPDFPRLSIEPTLFGQVLQNLFENSAKYASEAAHITIASKLAHNRTATLIIMDDGPGIDAKNRKAIFEKYQRMDEGDRAYGAGLGLAICRGIVEAHGATLNASKRPDDKKGACFTIKIPRNYVEKSNT
tara:strand:- start:1130 stop:2566 length:1437 start_codon:yes stop_codon:yes gene_type:complete